MHTALILAGLLGLAFFIKRTIMSNTQDVLNAISAIGAQLQKALAEIEAAINTGDSDAILAALGPLKAAAQALDDLNPDAEG